MMPRPDDQLPFGEGEDGEAPEPVSDPDPNAPVNDEPLDPVAVPDGGPVPTGPGTEEEAEGSDPPSSEDDDDSDDEDPLGPVTESTPDPDAEEDDDDYPVDEDDPEYVEPVDPEFFGDEVTLEPVHEYTPPDEPDGQDPEATLVEESGDSEEKH